MKTKTLQLGQWFFLLILGLLVACGGDGVTSEQKVGYQEDTVEGQEGPLLVASENPIQFGLLCIDVPATKEILIENQGTEDAVIYGIRTPSYLFECDLGELAQTGSLLAAGESAVISCTANFLSEMGAAATLLLYGEDAQKPLLNLGMTGTAVTCAGQQKLAVDPLNYHYFGNVCLLEKQVLPITLKNVGTETLAVVSVQSNFNSPDIRCESSTGFYLEPNEEAQLLCTYRPTSETYATGKLNILSDDPFQSITSVELSGHGTRSGCDFGAKISVSPTNMDLGEVCFGEQAEQEITVQNIGTSELEIIGVKKESSTFGLVLTHDLFGAVLQPNEVRTILVRYQPEFINSNDTWSINIETNDVDNQVVTVKGQGKATTCVEDPAISCVLIEAEAELGFVARVPGNSPTYRDNTDTASGCGFVTSAASATSLDSLGNALEIMVDVPKAAEYELFARVGGEDYGENSFWVAIDDAEPFWFEFEPATETNRDAFTCQPVSENDPDAQTQTPVSVHLEQGRHVITFWVREANAKLDSVYLTTDAEYCAPCSVNACSDSPVEFE